MLPYFLALSVWGTYNEAINVPPVRQADTIRTMKIVGREKEQQMLYKAYNSDEAELIAVYGRRRVGKTHLVREYFMQQDCVFLHATGIRGGRLQEQLQGFAEVLSAAFFNDAPLETPKSWRDSFALLTKQFAEPTQKVVMFLDELPWMATRKSGLLQALDYYWNRHWVQIPNLIVIVCGSSASWLIKKIIYNKGGLHNRVTCQIRLDPFSLSETKAFLRSKKINLSNDHILSLYMAVGGIPYYLKYVRRGLTAKQKHSEDAV